VLGRLGRGLQGSLVIPEELAVVNEAVVVVVVRLHCLVGVVNLADVIKLSSSGGVS
jgi:hypothetical protein